MANRKVKLNALNTLKFDFVLRRFVSREARERYGQQYHC